MFFSVLLEVTLCLTFGDRCCSLLVKLLMLLSLACHLEPFSLGPCFVLESLNPGLGLERES